MIAPTRLGKYLLLERLHLGGIAELFLARATGIPGAEPLVALKRLLPTQDEELVSLFVDEARIAAQLGHGNIARMLEVGSQDDQYFIAMEYISGRSLRALLQSPMVGGRPMAVEQAAYLAGELCDGLDYAHRKKDFQGRELGIVHRGVSPENVLLAYDGSVKLVDFGMAKAASSSHQTQAGSLKGKFGYMSPEQMLGQPLDRRSDIFSVGVVLFEMLTGTNPFIADSDLESMRRVSEADVPAPRSLNPELPEAVEAILLKALAKDRDARFQWASELQQALLPFTLAEGNSFSSQQLGEVMTTFFGEDAERDAERLRRLSEYQELPDQAPERVVSPGMSGRAETPGPLPFAPPPDASMPFDFGELDPSDRTQIVMAPSFDPLPAPDEPTPKPGPPPRRNSPSRPSVPAQRGSGSRPVGKRPTGSNPALSRGSGPRPSPARTPTPPPEPPPEAEDPYEVTRPGFLVGEDVLAPQPSPPSDGPPPAVAPPASASLQQLSRFVRTRNGMIAVGVGVVLLIGLLLLATRTSSPGLSTVRVSVIPAEKAQVTVGGRLIESGKPTQLPPGDYDLIAVAPGFKQHLQRIAVLANEPEAVFTVLLEPEQTQPVAKLPVPPPTQTKPTPNVEAPAKVFTAKFVSVDPGVEISVEGKAIGRTPSAEVSLPVGSAYRYEARREGFEDGHGLFGSSGERSVTVMVALKKAKVRPVVTHHATPKVSAKGGLVCSTQPAGARVEVDGKATRVTTPIYQDDPLMLPVGKHRVVFVLGKKRSAAHTVRVEKDKLVFLKDVVIAGAKSSSGGGLDSPEMMTP